MNDTQEQILHIAYLPRAGYVYPLLNALDDSPSPRAKKVRAGWMTSGAASAAVALSSKLVMLNLSVERLYRSVQAMRAAVADCSHAERVAASNKTLPIKPDDLPFELLLDLEVLMLEFRSAFEMLRRYLLCVHKLLALPRPKEPDLVAELEAGGVPTAWIAVLKNRRDRLAHEAPGWIAYRVKSFSPLVAQELFTNTPGMDEGLIADALSIDDIRAIPEGMSRALDHFQDALVERVREF
jgi:hypothetical protein